MECVQLAPSSKIKLLQNFKFLKNIKNIRIFSLILLSLYLKFCKRLTIALNSTVKQQNAQDDGHIPSVVFEK